VFLHHSPQVTIHSRPFSFVMRSPTSSTSNLPSKGVLTAGLCYVIYNGVDWPGISTAVTTCFLTALSTVGSSRQKQVLRISGAVVGGFLIGMGSQVFILPYLDSIAGFTIFFVVVTAFASWFMTSSPRLSYFGVQIAVAFCLIHLNSFAIEPSLSIARDRVVGILFGLIMMWLVFDQLWGASAVSDMKRGVPFGCSIAGSICTRADLERLQRGRGTQLVLPP